MTEQLHPLFDLSGRVALVTGGGSGLGREFCEILAEFGADVVCPDVRKDRAEETCEIIKKYGRRALPLELDVSNCEQVQAMFKKIEDTFGQLDILVNNAGIRSRPALIHEMDLEDWHRVIAVNLHGVFYCTREAVKMMMKQNKGSIINIASILGTHGLNPDIDAAANYGVSKAAVIGLTRQSAAEYGRYNIRVNCIAPGWYFGTRLASDAGIIRSEEVVKARTELLSSKTPLKRTGEPRELRGILLYLASDASNFMTGQIIACDGGWTCWRP